VAPDRERRRRWIAGLILLLVILLIILWWLLGRRAPGVPGMNFRQPPVVQLPSSVAAPQAAPAPTPPEALPSVPTVPAISAHRHRSFATARRPSETLDDDDPEAVLLESALKRLRREHDPRGALAILDTYQANHPAGVLRPEALVIRAETLLDLGRYRELVDLLGPERVSDLPRARDLALLRAEALSHLDHCREAIAVFDALLSGPLRNATASDRRERALYGRALCLAKTGRLNAARRDLELEAREFPDQAAKVRQTLETLKRD
jgi:hypothetical protein